MRRVVPAVLAAIALAVGAVAPVGAQESDVLVITPDEGSPGEVVGGKIDPAVVADECITDPQAVMDWFGLPWPAGAQPPSPGPVSQAWIDQGPSIGIDEPTAWPGTEVFPGFWIDGVGPPPAGVDPQNWAWYLYWTMYTEASGGAFPTWAPAGTSPTYEQKATTIVWELMDVLGQNFSGTAEDLLAQTFVLTFAEIATQEPIGDLANFDPGTGVGEVTVPEVAPGLYGVAATCIIQLAVTQGTFGAAAEQGAAFLQANNVPFDALLFYCLDDPGVPSSDCPGPLLAEALLSEMLPELVDFDQQPGPWTATFCVDCDPPASVNDAASFCGVLPDIQGVPDRLEALFAGADIDDPATYPSAGDLEALVGDVRVLLFGGDTSVPPTVAPQWSIATEDLRDLVWGVSAVEYDFALLVDLSPEDAQRLIDQGSGEPGEPDPEFDAALEVLTTFFLDNCITGGPAVPVDAVARFTG